MPFSIPMTRFRRINDLLLILRKWKARRKPTGPVVFAPSRAPVVDTTVLVGDISGEKGNQLQLGITKAVGLGSVQALGFQFSDSEGPESSIKAEILPGGRFPEFSRSFTEALKRIAGTRLLVSTPDLPGLGLGLLANYHFGKPLMYAGGGEAPPRSGGPDWANPAFLDPMSAAWGSLMAPFASEMPRKAEAARILPAAERFARMFAEFHNRISR